MYLRPDPVLPASQEAHSLAVLFLVDYRNPPIGNKCGLHLVTHRDLSRKDCIDAAEALSEEIEATNHASST